MKTFLLISSLLLVSFTPSFSDASSFETVCREATRGDDYEFCILALQGIPAQQTTNIRELAITAMGHLMANNVGTQGFDLTFKCVFGLVKAASDLAEAISKLESGNILGAIGEIGPVKDAIENCISDNSVGTNIVSAEVFASKLKEIDVARKILNWLNNVH